MARLRTVLQPWWQRANEWSTLHSVLFGWAMYIGIYVVIWARMPAVADSLATTLLIAYLVTGWATRWAYGIFIVAATSLLWWSMGFRGVEFDFGGSSFADAFATFVVGTFLLAAGRIGRIAMDASRESSRHYAALVAADARAEFQSRILHMAAHEINTPLTPIKLQLATLAPAVPGQAEAIERLQRNVARLERLTKDLGDAGRVQDGELGLTPGPMDLAKVVRAAVADVSAGEDRDWTVDAPDRLPLVADQQRLEQVTWNLLRNAVRYTPPGGAITVRLWEGDDGVHMQVQDAGLGMTQEQIDRAGTPFTQFHRDQVREGTGLGLFITKGIVAAHGGGVRIDSAGPGQGTTFTVRLPKA